MGRRKGRKEKEGERKEKEIKVMVEKNLKKLKTKKRRVMNGFNTGTRDMKLKTAYQRKKRWSAEDADHSFEIIC